MREYMHACVFILKDAELNQYILNQEGNQLLPLLYFIFLEVLFYILQQSRRQVHMW